MLLVQSVISISCAVIIGSALASFPNAFRDLLDGQKAIEEGLFGNDPLVGGVVDASVAAYSPQISVGDMVSLTTTGKAMFGFHALLHRYPLEMYLSSAGKGSSAIVSIARSALQATTPPSLIGVVLGATITSGSIKVNSSRGIVGIEQCSVLLPYSAGSGASTDESGSSPFARAFEAQADEKKSGPVAIGSTTVARATSASLVLFHNATTSIAPQNVYMYFSSVAAVETYAPTVGFSPNDIGYNGGARGFPTSTMAFFMLKFLNSAGHLTSEPLPIPLVMDEDPTDAVAFTFGLHGVRSTSPAAVAKAKGRSAIYLVPIPRDFRTPAFPTSDKECIRFGINASTSNTNIGLVPTSVSGSVPIYYHRGCFMAVVAPVSDLSAATDAISGVMSAVVAQWYALNAGSSSGYSEAVMAARRVTDGSGTIGARDGSTIRFVSVAMGPSSTSGAYVNLVKPMLNDAMAYLPPTFISWVGGVASLGYCSVPEFFDTDGTRRISVSVLK